MVLPVDSNTSEVENPEINGLSIPRLKKKKNRKKNKNRGHPFTKQTASQITDKQIENANKDDTKSNNHTTSQPGVESQLQDETQQNNETQQQIETEPQDESQRQDETQEQFIIKPKSQLLSKIQPKVETQAHLESQPQNESQCPDKILTQYETQPLGETLMRDESQLKDDIQTLVEIEPQVKTKLQDENQCEMETQIHQLQDEVAPIHVETQLRVRTQSQGETIMQDESQLKDESPPQVEVQQQVETQMLDETQMPDEIKMQDDIQMQDETQIRDKLQNQDETQMQDETQPQNKNQQQIESQLHDEIQLQILQTGRINELQDGIQSIVENSLQLEIEPPVDSQRKQPLSVNEQHVETQILSKILLLHEPKSIESQQIEAAEALTNKPTQKKTLDAVSRDNTHAIVQQILSDMQKLITQLPIEEQSQIGKQLLIGIVALIREVSSYDASDNTKETRQTDIVENNETIVSLLDTDQNTLRLPSPYEIQPLNEILSPIETLQHDIKTENEILSINKITYSPQIVSFELLNEMKLQVGTKPLDKTFTQSKTCLQDKTQSQDESQPQMEKPNITQLQVETQQHNVTESQYEIQPQYKTRCQDKTQAQDDTQLQYKTQTKYESRKLVETEAKDETQPLEEIEPKDEIKLQDETQPKDEAQLLDKETHLQGETQPHDETQTYDVTQLKDEFQLYDVTQLQDKTQLQNETQLQDETQLKDETQLQDVTQMHNVTELQCTTQTSGISQLKDETQPLDVTEMQDETQPKYKSQPLDETQLHNKTQLQDVTQLQDATQIYNVTKLRGATQTNGITQLQYETQPFNLTVIQDETQLNNESQRLDETQTHYVIQLQGETQLYEVTQLQDETRLLNVTKMQDETQLNDKSQPLDETQPKDESQALDETQLQDETQTHDVNQLQDETRPQFSQLLNITERNNMLATIRQMLSNLQELITQLPVEDQIFLAEQHATDTGVFSSQIAPSRDTSNRTKKTKRTHLVENNEIIDDLATQTLVLDETQPILLHKKEIQSPIETSQNKPSLLSEIKTRNENLTIKQNTSEPQIEIFESLSENELQVETQPQVEPQLSDKIQLQDEVELQTEMQLQNKNEPQNQTQAKYEILPEDKTQTPDESEQLDKTPSQYEKQLQNKNKSQDETLPEDITQPVDETELQDEVQVQYQEPLRNNNETQPQYEISPPNNTQTRDEFEQQDNDTEVTNSSSTVTPDVSSLLNGAITMSNVKLLLEILKNLNLEGMVTNIQPQIQDKQKKQWNDKIPSLIEHPDEFQTLVQNQLQDKIYVAVESQPQDQIEATVTEVNRLNNVDNVKETDDKLEPTIFTDISIIYESSTERNVDIQGDINEILEVYNKSDQDENLPNNVENLYEKNKHDTETENFQDPNNKNTQPSKDFNDSILDNNYDIAILSVPGTSQDKTVGNINPTTSEIDYKAVQMKLVKSVTEPVEKTDEQNASMEANNTDDSYTNEDKADCKYPESLSQGESTTKDQEKMVDNSIPIETVVDSIEQEPQPKSSTPVPEANLDDITKQLEQFSIHDEEILDGDNSSIGSRLDEINSPTPKRQKRKIPPNIFARNSIGLKNNVSFQHLQKHGSLIANGRNDGTSICRQFINEPSFSRQIINRPTFSRQFINGPSTDRLITYAGSTSQQVVDQSSIRRQAMHGPLTIQQTIEGPSTIPADAVIDFHQHISFSVRPVFNIQNEPLRFHKVHGLNLILSHDNFVATRRKDAAFLIHGSAFSSRPVRIHELVCLRINDVSKYKNGVISFGFTTHDPNNIAHLPFSTTASEDNLPGYWNVRLDQSLCQKDQILRYYVDESGILHFGVNSIERGKLYLDVDVKQPIWVFLNIIGYSTSLTFEK